MNRPVTLLALLMLLSTLIYSDVNATLSENWRVDTRGVGGPILQLDLPDARGKKRTVFVAVEFARQCDPLFSYAEISGNRLGNPLSQALLKDSKIGIVLNGNFHTGHAARTNYDNGYEAAFGVSNELTLQLLVNVNSLVYVTPPGESIPLPTTNFHQGLQAVINFCRKRVK